MQYRLESASRGAKLEVGSGAGRFSEVFLKTTDCLLHSVDYSDAVDVNQNNNLVI